MIGGDAMPTAQQILNDIDLRYRNTFSVAQKLVWMNEEQRELFDVLEIDSPPYAFKTVEGVNFYPLPDDFDVTKIKTVTYQVSDDDPEWRELPFYRNDDRQFATNGPWYTVVSDAFYLHVPDGVPDNRLVYIYYDKDPTEVTEDNLDHPVDLPAKYHELLKLGVLKRIAAARKDVLMYNNYNADYEQKLADILWLRKMKEPEWNQPIDMMPKLGGFHHYVPAKFIW